MANVLELGNNILNNSVLNELDHMSPNIPRPGSAHSTSPLSTGCREEPEVTFQTRFAAHLLNNSSVLEIALVCLTCPIAAFMRDLIISWLADGKKLTTWCRIVVDNLSLGLPGIYCMTMFSDDLHDLHTILWSIIGLFLIRNLNADIKDMNSNTNPLPAPGRLMNLPMSQRRDFVSSFRAYVNFAASVAILAVDFPSAFPTRFGKRQTYGTGLMDVGVGGYVVSYGIVSHEARGIVNTGRQSQNKWKPVLQAVKSSAPMWILGMIRTMFLMVTGFHAHETEYGVHWNFFFTLAFVRVASTIVLTMCPSNFAWVGSILLMITFQCTVQSNNISEYIFLGPADDIGSRKGFLNANREGLASCIGYLAIYLASVSIGWFLAFPRNTFRDWLKALLLLLVLDVILWNSLANLSRMEPWLEPISRRMANLQFVVWMMAHQLYLICCFFVVDLTSTALGYAGLLHKSEKSDFSLMEAVNRNGLFYFVMANILVGVVNVSITTNTARSYVGYGVLFVYIMLLTSLCTILHIKNITLKHW